MSLEIMPVSMSRGIVAPNRDETSDHRPDFVKKLFPGVVACDAPEEGGISGNIKVGEKDKPHPYALEERPAKYDLHTGEMVYKDKLPKPYVLYLA